MGMGKTGCNLINYINKDLEIRITKQKGRGIFAKTKIKQGTLLIVEKPIAFI